MTADLLSMLAGALLSLTFSYVPGLRQWFERLGAQPDDGGARKRLVMLILLAAVAGGSFALRCTSLGALFLADLPQPLTCDSAGVAGLVKALLLALVANQGIYQISPRQRAAAGLQPGRPV